MRICRYISEDRLTRTGIWRPEEPKVAQVIEGDIFSDFHVTGEMDRIQRLLSPLKPTAIFALGFNYGKHAEETGAHLPTVPVLFMKAPTSVIGPKETILLPLAGPDRVDYEGELAVIIGKRGKNIRREEALNYVFGYTCANDVSARDWQMDKERGQKGQWVRGKSFDTFCPLGPVIVTADEIPGVPDLKIRTVLNHQIVQDSSTGDMIFDVPTIISELSRSMTLEAGTVILTGTPEGVGYTRVPPLFLRPGDEIRIEIERVGVLVNQVDRERP
ncbi:MAG TPA: fumarylacetoacetate hydrolase family protein [Syntrophales bacterium]|nr:fumarylacetoacetate hydrolase family protein [Syntrophales bacterium]HOL58296.1 fumarylacetoacetate hydrolase family protein [Syntrophales bacterium]HPO34465.1 fumarylacetoacetate hydrolase family protein [Syntrophales bacterium]